jgi:ESCRT-I complex subunit VPS37
VKMSSLEPDYPMALSRLQVLSKDELHELFTNEAKFDDHIRSLEQMKQLYSEKEMLMTSNKSLAEYNLSQEPMLKQKREALTEKHRQAIEMMSELRKTKEKIEAKSGKVKPDVLYSLLQVAQSEAERDSDALMDDLLSGKITNIDEFLEKFMEKRKVYHLRRVKLEKMKEIIDGKTKQLTPIRAAPKPPAIPGIPPSRGASYPVSGPSAAPANSWGMPISPTYTSPAAANLPYPINPTYMPTGPPTYR